MTMPIIEPELAPKNKFPIVAQLLVLAIILSGVFSSLFFLQPNNAGNTPATPQTIFNQTASTPTSETPQKITGVAIKADAAYVWDVAGQRALFKKNESEVLPLASITKLMTALVAHELIAEQEYVSVPLSAIRQEGSSGLSAGEQLTAEQLNELALISSSNDAAYALAASVGELLGERDPAQQFITGMNIRANELQLPTLAFLNTTGLDVSKTQPGAVGSARDVSFLMEYILTNYPDILTPTTNDSARVYNTAGAYHDINNTNPIVSEIPNLIGSKTGYTDLAGGNLTVAFDLGLNRPIIITVLGSTRDERFSDVLELVEAVQATVTDQSYE